MDTLRGRAVALGARYLDREQPGWAENVPADLDVGCNNGCVLGHLYGSFGAGLQMLGLTTQDAERLGLYVPGQQITIHALDAYAELTEAWRQERQKRLEQSISARHLRETHSAEPEFAHACTP